MLTPNRSFWLFLTKKQRIFNSLCTRISSWSTPVSTRSSATLGAVVLFQSGRKKINKTSPGAVIETVLRILYSVINCQKLERTCMFHYKDQYQYLLISRQNLAGKFNFTFSFSKKISLEFMFKPRSAHCVMATSLRQRL